MTATVVDRAGITVVVARADNAGLHTGDANRRKANTSASARNTTAAIAENVPNNPASAALARIDGFLVLASGAIDEKCAADAINAVFPSP